MTEVDALDMVEPLAQYAEGAAQLTRGARRTSRLPSRGPQLLSFALERGVVRVAVAPERFDDDGVAVGIERVGRKYGRFSARRDDLTSDPLEILAALRGVRQHVHGVARRHGANVL